MFCRIEEKRGSLRKKLVESDLEEMDFDRMGSKIRFLSYYFRVRIACLEIEIA